MYYIISNNNWPINCLKTQLQLGGIRYPELFLCNRAVRRIDKHVFHQLKLCNISNTIKLNKICEMKAGNAVHTLHVCMFNA